MEQTAELEKDTTARSILTRFLTNVGSPTWEKEFGALWDKFAEEAKEDEDEE